VRCEQVKRDNEKAEGRRKAALFFIAKKQQDGKMPSCCLRGRSKMYWRSGEPAVSTVGPARCVRIQIRPWEPWGA